MLCVKEIYKKYGDIKALDGLSFEANKGEIVGIIGPNGAGKTTLFRIIAGLIKKYKGSISINNKTSFFKTLEFVSYLPEEPKFREEFNVNQLFKTHALLYRVKKDQIYKQKPELIKLFNLGSCIKQPLSTLSKGNRKRAYFMAALANLNKSDLLLLDEPFDGIDPEKRVRIRRYLKTLKNKIILLSSHTLFDVEKIADRVILIKDGKKYKEIKDIEPTKLEDEFMKMVEGKNE